MQTSRLDDRIRDDEVLYRAVLKRQPDAFIDGRPTAALFMDEGGVSVDRDGGRPEADILASFESRFNKRGGFIACAKITAGGCRAIGVLPCAIGNFRNIYHAEIHESESEVGISLLHALQLANTCTVVQAA